MKLFMEPAIEVAKFAVEDVITVSDTVTKEDPVEEPNGPSWSGMSCWPF